MGLARRAALVILAVFLGALLQVNAPSIWSGWGLVSAAIALAILALPPLHAGLAVLLGSLAALPLQVASKSIFPTVALAGVLVRPPLAAVSGVVARRYGALPGLLAWGALSGLATLTVAIVYYGNDGIHASMAVFDVLLVLLVFAAYHASKPGTPHALAAGGLLLLYILGTYAFPGPAPLVALIGLAVLAATTRLGLEKHGLYAAVLLLLAGVAAGYPSLVLNAKVLGYPLDPGSYSPDRWSSHGACGLEGSLLRGVHDPERLRILEPCVEVTGRIAEIPSVAGDGDYNFELEAGDVPLSHGNIILLHGLLHAEIVPADMGILESVGGKLCRGDTVTIRGPLVVDTDHGQWVEVHPVVSLELVERGEGPCVGVEG